MTVKSYNGYVPYLFLASSLATWLRIRIILIITLILMVIQMALSGYTMQSSSAGFEKFDSSYSNWDGNVCDQSPTTYLQPFAFTYTATNSTTGITIASSIPATCPFPISNSAFRLTSLCVGFIILGGLFFQSLMSGAARTIILCFALLFFSCFVLDTNQVLIGFATCERDFYGTNLGTTITKKHVHISCNSDAHVTVVMFDFFISILLYLVFECWGMCADLYGEKDTRISVITKPANSRAPDVENPLHNSATTSKPASRISKQVPKSAAKDIDYTPYEATQQDYTPYEKPSHEYTPYEKPSTKSSVPSKKPPSPAKRVR